MMMMMMVIIIVTIRIVIINIINKYNKNINEYYGTSATLVFTTTFFGDG